MQRNYFLDLLSSLSTTLPSPCQSWEEIEIFVPGNCLTIIDNNYKFHTKHSFFRVDELSILTAIDPNNSLSA